MTHQDQARVSVRIMEKEFVVACPYDERSALLATSAKPARWWAWTASP